MATAKSGTAAGHLSTFHVLAFASASIPIQALVLAISVHLPRYFASHIGLELAVVGAAFAMVRLIDIPIDVGLGMAMDRTRTRFGRYRVWLALGTPVMMAGLWFVLQAGPSTSQLGLSGILLFLYIGYSMVYLSHLAWGGVLGPTYEQRNRVFGAIIGLGVAGSVAVLLIPRPAQRESHQATSLETIFGGFRYIFSNKVVLGAISLDMFAVLMGGAVALLPVYTKDILHAGPQELGLLRAAPGIGAIAMALWLTRFPIRDHAGKLLFLFVGLFGLFTAVFGFSTTVWISIPALALVGASDMVSVTIRETIMQLWTPEEVRGRVNAVNSVFIGASNELGEFRAGTVAHFIGPVAAVGLGGIGAMGIAIIWSRIFPGLREQRSLDRKMVD